VSDEPPELEPAPERATHPGASLHAIPTTYAGVNFRSRTEARWAALFDLLDLRWDYEPIDLHGYIPDFIVTLDLGPVLVEVKPILWPHTKLHYGPWPDLGPELARAAIAKVRASGWDGPTVIVGATLGPSLGDLSTLGIGYPAAGDAPHVARLATVDRYHPDGDAYLGTSYALQGVGPWGQWASRTAPVQGTRGDWLMQIWREAGNRVQWVKR
jgi:hypothetical protein